MEKSIKNDVRIEKNDNVIDLEDDVEIVPTYPTSIP